MQRLLEMIVIATDNGIVAVSNYSEASKDKYALTIDSSTNSCCIQ